MPKNDRLRAVKPGEVVPEPERALALGDAVKTGDYYQILLAQQAEIAASIPAEVGPAKAALHRQLSQVSEKLEELRVKRREAAKESAGAAVKDAAFDATAI